MNLKIKINYKNNKNNKNLEKKHSKIEGKTSSKVLKQELKWNKKEKYSFYKSYKSRSRLIKERKKKKSA